MFPYLSNSDHSKNPIYAARGSKDVNGQRGWENSILSFGKQVSAAMVDLMQRPLHVGCEKYEFQRNDI